MIASGHLGAGEDPPLWVIVSAASAIALGTYTGGWRIIRIDGHEDHQDGSGAGVLGPGRRRRGDPGLHFGFPLSTTQVIAGGRGAGAGKRLSAGRGVAGNIVTAWVLTLPAAAAIGGLTYLVVDLFPGALGPVLVSAAGLALVAFAFARRVRQPVRRPSRRMLATIVDTSALWQTIVAAFVAGVGTTLVFSLAILGVARLAEANRQGRSFQSAAFAPSRYSARWRPRRRSCSA